ncbi:glycosyltransferase family protein [Rhabdobacter roseus]|uniref:Uncharacterized protein (TIGR00661 family) n=1 Tax=Rhabdobacter roseus TaxID=1655419 RepID=A0A840TDD0_9BACT|nr:glycosyltransferase family protein [Rhabdobacter roseus]MBB5282106.1 uncharacterized protein (TIGR00661 family) [Rhabdobacter roseus]
MKILFLVQGEGRGHLTQAIALSQIVRRAGHEVVAVLVGQAEGREIPAFFREQMQVPIHSFSSPSLIYHKKKARLDLAGTFATHSRQAGRYLKSLRYIHERVQQAQPDLIVNFYELLGGLYNFLYRPAAPLVCIAHQYLLLHPHFSFPKKSWLDRQLVNLNTRLTALGARRRLALSFRPLSHAGTLAVVPPLLRHDLRQLRPTQGTYLLVYMTHHSLSQQILAWHRQHPEVPLHCFWDKPNAAEEEVLDETLTFHRINGPKYLRLMEGCRALVTTAGFESVCEAMYLGKPVLMVPVPGHFEQACNALDGVLSGAGATASTFDLSVLTQLLPYYRSPQREFRTWCQQSEYVFVRQLEEVAKPQPAAVPTPTGTLAWDPAL